MLRKKLEWLIDNQRIFWIGGTTLFVIGILLGCFFFLGENQIMKKDNLVSFSTFDDMNDTTIDTVLETVGEEQEEPADSVSHVEDGKEVALKESYSQIVVDIKGAVLVPGIYTVDPNTRVMQVIDKAGGLTENADVSVINLGKKVFDEMVIFVYTKEEVANFVTTKEELVEKIEACPEVPYPNDACVCVEDTNIYDQNVNADSDNSVFQDSNESVASSEVTSGTSKVSLNQASLEELMTLTGIGEVKAQAIISYREANGGFKSIDELKNVNGIGDSIFEKIKDQLTI